MPPRHAYWTIIVDDQPTSFRAHELEELLPTFNRLREKHPNTQLKWFERGQLWESRDAARAQGFGRGERRWEGPRPEREDDSRDYRSGAPFDAPRGRDSKSRGSGAPHGRDSRSRGLSGPPSDRADQPPRDREWRPGGEHRDPRQKFKDAKKAKWDRYKQSIRKRWEDKQRDRPVADHGEHTPPHGDPMRPKLPGGGARPTWKRDDRRSDRAREERTFRRDDDWRGWTPKGSPRGRENWRNRDDRKPAGPPKRPWGSKPPAAENRSWEPKPGGGAKRPWGTKPSAGGKRPWGSQVGGAKKSWGPPRRPRGPRKPRGDDE
jgi:hypothetical protein